MTRPTYQPNIDRIKQIYMSKLYDDWAINTPYLRLDINTEHLNAFMSAIETNNKCDANLDNDAYLLEIDRMLMEDVAAYPEDYINEEPCNDYDRRWIDNVWQDGNLCDRLIWSYFYATHPDGNSQPWKNYAVTHCIVEKRINEAFDFCCWALDNVTDYDEFIAKWDKRDINPPQQQTLIPLAAPQPIAIKTATPNNQPTNKTTNKTSTKPMAKKSTWREDAIACFPGITPTESTDRNGNRQVLTFDEGGVIYTFTYEPKGRHQEAWALMPEGYTIEVNGSKGNKVVFDNHKAARIYLTDAFDLDKRYPNADSCIVKVIDTTAQPKPQAAAPQPVATPAPQIEQTAPVAAPQTASTPTNDSPLGSWYDADADADFVYIAMGKADNEFVINYFNDGVFESADTDKDLTVAMIEQNGQGYTRCTEQPECITQWLLKEKQTATPEPEPIAEQPAAPVMQQVNVEALFGALNTKGEARISDFATPVPEQTAAPSAVDEETEQSIAHLESEADAIIEAAAATEAAFEAAATEPIAAPTAEPEAKAESAAKRYAVESINAMFDGLSISQLTQVRSFIAGMVAQASIA